MFDAGLKLVECWLYGAGGFQPHGDHGFSMGNIRWIMFCEREEEW